MARRTVQNNMPLCPNMTRIGYYLINPTNEQHVFLSAFSKNFCVFACHYFQQHLMKTLNQIKNIQSSKGPSTYIFFSQIKEARVNLFLLEWYITTTRLLLITVEHAAKVFSQKRVLNWRIRRICRTYLFYTTM